MRFPADMNASEEGAVLKVKLTRLSGSEWLMLILKQKRRKLEVNCSLYKLFLQGTQGKMGSMGKVCVLQGQMYGG